MLMSICISKVQTRFNTHSLVIFTGGIKRKTMIINKIYSAQDLIAYIKDKWFLKKSKVLAIQIFIFKLFSSMYAKLGIFDKNEKTDFSR